MNVLHKYKCSECGKTFLLEEYKDAFYGIICPRCAGTGEEITSRDKLTLVYKGEIKVKRLYR